MFYILSYCILIMLWNHIKLINVLYFIVFINQEQGNLENETWMIEQEGELLSLIGFGLLGWWQKKLASCIPLIPKSWKQMEMGTMMIKWPTWFKHESQNVSTHHGMPLKIKECKEPNIVRSQISKFNFDETMCRQCK